MTSGVAGLGLSPRRFSLSRQPSEDPNAAGAAGAGAAGAAGTAGGSNAAGITAGGVAGDGKKDSIHAHHGKPRGTVTHSIHQLTKPNKPSRPPAPNPEILLHSSSFQQIRLARAPH